MTELTENIYNRKIKEVSAQVSIGLSIFLVIVLSLSYILRPDWLAAVTFYPPWVWPIPGIFLAIFFWRTNKKVCLLVIFVWLIFVLVFAEEIIPLARAAVFQSPKEISAKQKMNQFRVVSLNCAGGNLQAAREVIQYKPDIVLLQEAPPKEQTELCANELFQGNAAVAWSIDTAIITRGEIRSREPKESFMTHAGIVLDGNMEIEIMDIRLFPPASSINLFDPTVWKEHFDDRKLRRKQLEKIAEQISNINQNIPIILGGDFNVSADDGVLRVLKPSLTDTYKEKGIGWGKTAINTFPIFRVDQIWVSKHFKVLGMWASKTENSDHRMVICDVILK